MKVVGRCMIAIAIIGVSDPQVWAQSSILISELCDPHLNYTTDRFIEIYNAGSTASDLAGWSVVAVGNGGDIFTWNLSGQINPGEALVCGDDSTVTVFAVDFPDEAWSNNNGLWNGKVGDGAKLIDPSMATVDYVVVPGTVFENDDYVRNYDITTANPVYNPSEWTTTPVELATDASPGTHRIAMPTANDRTHIEKVRTIRTINPGAALAVAWPTVRSNRSARSSRAWIISARVPFHSKPINVAWTP